MRHRSVGLPGSQGGRRDRDVRGARDPTHVAIVRVGLHIPQSRSLKEKRAVIKPVVEGLRQRFSLSVAEVGFHDKWQRSLIGFAVVSGDHHQAAEVVDAVERWVWSRPDIEVTGFEAQWVTADS